MAQPTGFVDKDNPDYVCKLKRWFMDLLNTFSPFTFRNGQINSLTVIVLKIINLQTCRLSRHINVEE